MSVAAHTRGRITNIVAGCEHNNLSFRIEGSQKYYYSKRLQRQRKAEGLRHKLNDLPVQTINPITEFGRRRRRLSWRVRLHDDHKYNHAAS